MRAARRDDNHAEIRDAYRDIGFSVYDAGNVHAGFPDLVVGKYGITCLVEVKDPKKPPSARALTTKQMEFHADWKGDARIIMTVDDVIQHDKELLMITKAKLYGE